ncbi:MAG TPA: transglycosylase domain-containing protein [Pyrinomonadaceae bacterium]|jgi:monofunctional biosynthetic peptidoglycan transglycosylase
MRHWIKVWSWVLVGVFIGWLGYEFITFPSISKLRTENPATTSLIETRIKEAKARGEEPRRYQIWVPLERISPSLQRAVLAGEDSNFATHHGFDYAAIQHAWEEAQRESEKEAKQEGDDQSSWIPAMPDFKRGASTITQQLAKNLYLSSQRSFVRKGREAVITYFIERSLSKSRILEIYLNVIEWGDGIYGAEAASQYYFRKPASQLTPREAAYLSAMIPGPLKLFNPRLNPRRVARRQRVILRGMPSVQMPPGTG